MRCPHCGLEFGNTKTNYDRIQELYNKTCLNLPRCELMTDARKKAIKARTNILKSKEDWLAFFQKVNASDFLNGRKTDWKVTSIDWILKSANFTKIYEGSYDNETKTEAPKPKRKHFIIDRDGEPYSLLWERVVTEEELKQIKENNK